MKITIEPTSDSQYHRKVSVEIPGDDHGLSEVHELVFDALRAWGFSDKTLTEILK